MPKVLVEGGHNEIREYLVPRYIHVNVQDGGRVKADVPCSATRRRSRKWIRADKEVSA